jgi:adenosine 3'-phospho 5'-phosphosulfate transporter B3
VESDSHVLRTFYRPLVFTNIFTLIAMTITTLLSGDLVGMFIFARSSAQLCNYVAVYTFVAYIAISIHMNVVRRFGGVAAVLLATGRKGMTLVLSFVLFPKAFSWYYVTGAMLVLGGLLLSSLVKINEKKRRAQLNRKSSDMEMEPFVSTGDNQHSNDIEHNLSDTLANGAHGGDGLSHDNGEVMERRQSPRESGGFFGRHVHDHQQ